jgi:hypothetical protein
MSADLMTDAEFAEWIKRYRPEAIQLAREMLGLESDQEPHAEDEREREHGHAA